MLSYHSGHVANEPAMETLRRSDGQRSPLCPSVVKSCAAREVLCLEGAPADRLYEVLTGVVKFYKTTLDGRRQILGFAYPGQWFAVSADRTYPYTVECVTDAHINCYRREDVVRKTETCTASAAYFMRITGECLRHAEEQILMLGQKNALEKLASFLLLIHRRQCVGGAPRGAEGAIHLPMDRLDIADFLGMTIETVSRKFSYLKRAGVISLLTPNNIQVRDMRMLEAYAESESEALL